MSRLTDTPAICLQSIPSDPRLYQLHLAKVRQLHLLAELRAQQVATLDLLNQEPAQETEQERHANHVLATATLEELINAQLGQRRRSPRNPGNSVADLARLYSESSGSQ